MPKLTNEDLANIAANTQGPVLNIQGLAEPLTEALLSTFEKAVACNRTLKTLFIEYIPGREESISLALMQSLVRALRANPEHGIKAIGLKSIPMYAALHLTQYLAEAAPQIELGLAEMPDLDVHLDLFKTPSRTTHLSLMGLSSEDTNSVVARLRDPRCSITTLSLVGFGDTPFPTGILERLAPALPHFKTLSKLILSKFSPEGLQIIYRALQMTRHPVAVICENPQHPAQQAQFDALTKQARDESADHAHRETKIVAQVPNPMPQSVPAPEDRIIWSPCRSPFQGILSATDSDNEATSSPASGRTSASPARSFFAGVPFDFDDPETARVKQAFAQFRQQANVDIATLRAQGDAQAQLIQTQKEIIRDLEARIARLETPVHRSQPLERYIPYAKRGVPVPLATPMPRSQAFHGPQGMPQPQTPFSPRTAFAPYGGHGFLDGRPGVDQGNAYGAAPHFSAPPMAFVHR